MLPYLIIVLMVSLLHIWVVITGIRHGSNNYKISFGEAISLKLNTVILIWTIILIGHRLSITIVE